MEHLIGALPRTSFPASRDFAPVGSMSLDFQVASLSYKSSFFATSRGNEKIGGTGYCVTYDTDSQSRNADFISIAAERQSTTLGLKGRQSSRRNQITLSAPHRTVRAVFPHTALRIVLGYHICTRIRGFGI